jgi:hypothetical protein
MMAAIIRATTTTAPTTIPAMAPAAAAPHRVPKVGFEHEEAELGCGGAWVKAPEPR